MRKLYFLLSIVLLLGCNKQEITESIEVSSVTLSQSSITLALGETVSIFANILPQNATNKEISWSSSNPSVAAVENGLIIALSKGKTTITATANDKGKQSAKCDVEVVLPASVVTGSVAFISPFNATLFGSFELPGDNLNNYQFGILLYSSPNIMSEPKYVQAKECDSNNDFNVLVKDLYPDSEYNYKSYLRIGDDYTYGHERTLPNLI